MLVSLKLLIIQRAKTIGCDELAYKFDLKMLRAIGMPYAFVYDLYACPFKISDALCSLIMLYACKILCFCLVDLSCAFVIRC